jgi:hypothetical protein
LLSGSGFTIDFLFCFLLFFVPNNVSPFLFLFFVPHPPILGRVHISHLVSCQRCALFLFCLITFCGLCQCFLYTWIVHFSFPLLFSVTFIFHRCETLLFCFVVYMFCFVLSVWFFSSFCPRDKELGGLLIYPCPSVRPSVRWFVRAFGYRYMVCPAVSSYRFGARALIFCRIFIHIMEVYLSTGFWFSSNILKMTGSWI